MSRRKLTAGAIAAGVAAAAAYFRLETEEITYALAGLTPAKVARARRVIAFGLAEVTGEAADLWLVRLGWAASRSSAATTLARARKRAEDRGFKTGVVRLAVKRAMGWRR